MSEEQVPPTAEDEAGASGIEGGDWRMHHDRTAASGA